MIRDHLLDVNSEDRVETRKIANLLKRCRFLLYSPPLYIGAYHLCYRNVSNAGHMSILIKKKPKLVLHIPKPDKDRNQPEKVNALVSFMHSMADNNNFLGNHDWQVQGEAQIWIKHSCNTRNEACCQERAQCQATTTTTTINKEYRHST